MKKKSPRSRSSSCSSFPSSSLTWTITPLSPLSKSSTLPFRSRGRQTILSLKTPWCILRPHQSQTLPRCSCRYCYHYYPPSSFFLFLSINIQSIQLFVLPDGPLNTSPPGTLRNAHSIRLPTCSFSQRPI